MKARITASFFVGGGLAVIVWIMLPEKLKTVPFVGITFVVGLLVGGWLAMWTEARRLRAVVRRDAMTAIRRLRR
jgi:hypothetical protein